MKRVLLYLVLLAGCSPVSKSIVLTEQAQNRVVIVDVVAGRAVWEWRADSSNVRREHVKWFNTPSDAKAVYGRRYVLITASGGGVALVRLLDKKAVFYARAGVNPHSAELLPDGNIVVASSNDSVLTIFRFDSLVAPEKVYKKNVFLEFGHNVVWDKKRRVLWSAAMNKLKSFRYNNDCEHPDLLLIDSVALPGTEAHDLFPVLGRDKLWLTNTTQVYQYDLKRRRLNLMAGIGAHVKSIGSGGRRLPVITTRPKEKWWTDEVMDIKGNSVFKAPGWKIYKARWWIDNPFSYGTRTAIIGCR